MTLIIKYDDFRQITRRTTLDAASSDGGVLARTAIELLGMQGPLYRGSRHLEDGGLWPYQFMFSLGMIIGGGTSQIQKNIIAQRGLGLPRH